MNSISLLDTSWKRLLAAAALSGAIIFSISTFAESTYIQSQKARIETDRGQHCQKWQYQKIGNGEKSVSCEKWAG